jgi:hypothetical protein
MHATWDNNSKDLNTVFIVLQNLLTKRYFKLSKGNFLLLLVEVHARNEEIKFPGGIDYFYPHAHLHIHKTAFKQTVYWILTSGGHHRSHQAFRRVLEPFCAPVFSTVLQMSPLLCTGARTCFVWFWAEDHSMPSQRWTRTQYMPRRFLHLSVFPLTFLSEIAYYELQ